MNGKFNEIDKQDLIKRVFSEDNIFYLENLDSTEKKGLYLKICEVIDSGITAEQVMEKVKNRTKRKYFLKNLIMIIKNIGNKI